MHATGARSYLVDTAVACRWSRHLPCRVLCVNPAVAKFGCCAIVRKVFLFSSRIILICLRKCRSMPELFYYNRLTALAERGMSLLGLARPLRLTVALIRFAAAATAESALNSG